jgi:hypothetical protein
VKSIASKCLEFRNKPHKQAIPKPETSAWDVLWRDGNGASFIVLTSLTREAFMRLLRDFSVHFNYKSGPGNVGDHRNLLRNIKYLDYY